MRPREPRHRGGDFVAVLESGNCQEEAIICKVLDMGDRKRRLIPLVIEPVSMPAWLYGIVGIDCTKRESAGRPVREAQVHARRSAGERPLNAESAEPAE